MTIRKVLKMATATAVLAALASLPATAYAEGAEDLIMNNGCGGCHKLDKKIFGPGFKEIAAKYKGDAAAPDNLLNSIKKGSTGKWSNNRAMPPQEAPEAEVKQIIAWILSQ